MEEPHAVTIARKALVDVTENLASDKPALYDPVGFVITNWNVLEAMSRLVENWDRQNAQQR